MSVRLITRLKTLRLALFLGLAFALALAAPTARPAGAGLGAIEAKIVRLRNNSGQVICTLFSPSDKFPDQRRKGMTIAVPIENKRATCRFASLPYGDYAIVAFHDENRDGNINQNWLGMPKEGFGFSNNPRTLRKPAFNDAKFVVDQSLIHITIKLNYWF